MSSSDTHLNNTIRYNLVRLIRAKTKLLKILAIHISYINKLTNYINLESIRSCGMNYLEVSKTIDVYGYRSFICEINTKIDDIKLELKSLDYYITNIHKYINIKRNIVWLYLNWVKYIVI